MIIDSLFTVVAINLPRHKCTSLAWKKYMSKPLDEGHRGKKMKILKCKALREMKMGECKVATFSQLCSRRKPVISRALVLREFKSDILGIDYVSSR